MIHKWRLSGWLSCIGAFCAQVAGMCRHTDIHEQDTLRDTGAMYGFFRMIGSYGGCSVVGARFDSSHPSCGWKVAYVVCALSIICAFPSMCVKGLIETGD